MEFRQVVHSVRRTAAAATSRPSLLAGTRPSPSAALLLLLQHNRFTTSSQKPSEAVAVAQPQQTQPPPPPQRTRSDINELRESVSSGIHLPPRPPPVLNGTPFSNRAFKQQLFRNRPSPTQQRHPQQSSAAGYELIDEIARDATRGLNSSPGNLTEWSEEEFLKKSNYQQEPELRLRPSTGRTVHVKGKQDVASALRRLEREVANNAVRRDAREQRFYERPALKRKREKRERWRARFKDGFYACLTRARELKAQGW